MTSNKNKKRRQQQLLPLRPHLQLATGPRNEQASNSPQAALAPHLNSSSSNERATTTTRSPSQVKTLAAPKNTNMTINTKQHKARPTRNGTAFARPTPAQAGAIEPGIASQVRTIIWAIRRISSLSARRVYGRMTGMARNCGDSRDEGFAGKDQPVTIVIRLDVKHRFERFSLVSTVLYSFHGVPICNKRAPSLRTSLWSPCCWLHRIVKIPHLRDVVAQSRLPLAHRKCCGVPWTSAHCRSSLEPCILQAVVYAPSTRE